MPKVNLTKDISTHLNMMSQLDGPFLVTDSPQVKAAVIGRLTGTQIIDLAIKEVNRTLLSNSKAIKETKKNIQDREDELERYNDLEYEREYLKYYDAILVNDNYRRGCLCNVCDAYNSIESKSASLLNLNCRIYEEQSKMDYCSLYIEICNYIINQSEITEVFNELQTTQNNIRTLKVKINWLKIITSLKVLVEQCRNKFNSYITLKNVYERIKQLRTEIQQNESTVKNCTDTINTLQDAKKYLNSIMSYINVLYKNYSSTLPLYQNSVKRINNVRAFETERDTLIESINQYQTESSNLVQQQEQLIKDNNICPCCGQKISSDVHIQNINNFMKGKRNG